GLIVAIALGSGCGPMDSDDDANPDAEIEDSCVAPNGMGQPSSIDELVAYINAMPKPLDLPCFLESLERPLAIYATSHRFSAQSPPSADSPRVFIINGGMSLSVVTAGSASQLLEMGEHTSSGMTIKGEIEFPIDGELPRSAPYEQIVDEFGEGTRCRFCHLHETRLETIGFAEAYVSEYIAGLPEHRVSLPAMHDLAATCDAEADPHRCAMFDALFGQGSVLDGEL